MDVTETVMDVLQVFMKTRDRKLIIELTQNIVIREWLYLLH